MTTDAVKQPRGLMALANPTRFLAFVQIVLPYLSLTALALLAVGLWMAFSVPDDYQQGRTVRIMFVHVPSVWMAMSAYMVMVSGALGSAGLAAPAGRCCCPRGGTNRGGVYFSRPRHRINLGSPDVGDLVGMGCPVDQFFWYC